MPSEAYKRYSICKEFGYTYQEYEALPAWWVEEILTIMNQEGQKQKREVEKPRVKPAISRMPRIRRK